MPANKAKQDIKHFRGASMSRLETLGDAIFAFALTLLALDLRLPEMSPDKISQGIISLLPKLLFFVFAFLLVAQQWDVHQRTIRYIELADDLFVWLYLITLMFVVLLPVTANILVRNPFESLALIFFGINLSLLCLASWLMWQYASRNRKLIRTDIEPYVVKMIASLWIYPPIIIIVSLLFICLSITLVYISWFLMPVISYAYSLWITRKHKVGPNRG